MNRDGRKWRGGGSDAGLKLSETTPSSGREREEETEKETRANPGE